jgi:hypothetical protein
LGGRQPLCGTGVTSVMLLIFMPSAFNARTRKGPKRTIAGKKKAK